MPGVRARAFNGKPAAFVAQIKRIILRGPNFNCISVGRRRESKPAARRKGRRLISNESPRIDSARGAPPGNFFHRKIEAAARTARPRSPAAANGGEGPASGKFPPAA